MTSGVNEVVPKLSLVPETPESTHMNKALGHHLQAMLYYCVERPFAPSGRQPFSASLNTQTAEVTTTPVVGNPAPNDSHPDNMLRHALRPVRPMRRTGGWLIDFKISFLHRYRTFHHIDGACVWHDVMTTMRQIVPQMDYLKSATQWFEYMC